jgi:hypothetical protein
MIIPDEYALTLKTGERIDVSEFAFERIPALASVKGLVPLWDVLRGCAVMSRDGVEAAKMGWDVELRRTVKDPVAGLLKLLRPECAHVGTCIMADRHVCTSKNVTGKRRIPPCWEHASEGELQEVVNSIVLAWAAKRRVVIVVPDPQALQEALASGAPRAG